MLMLAGSGIVMGSELKVGQAFPTLILPQAEDGAPSSLLAYRGQKTVLHVFASW